MGWTAPYDGTAGEIITEDIWDTYLKDNLRYLKGLDGVPTIQSGLIIASLLGTEYLRIPSLTTTERDLLTPANGMIIYNETTNEFNKYENSFWEDLGDGVDHGGLDGLTDDDHTQYRLESADHTHQSTGAQAGQLDHGLALTGLTDDDHTQYRLESADHSHQTTGAEAGQIDHGAAMTAASLLDDDHTQYQKESEKGANSGYCGLDAGGLVDATDLPDASATAEGISELATAAEITTGTDTARTICPDAFAGSVYGKRVIQLKLVNEASNLDTGDGKFIFCIPLELNGYNLVDADAFVTTVSTSGTPTYQIRNITQTADMLTTRITINANEYTSYTATAPPVIDGNNDDVATGDLIAVDKDVVGTGEKGDGIILSFQLP